MDDRQARFDKVLTEVIDDEGTRQKDGLIHLSTGVVLALQPIPKKVIKSLYDRYEDNKPKPPLFDNELKNRKEENPADPDYLTALEVYETNFILTVMDFAVMRGTRVVTIPDDVEPIEGDWQEEYEYLGMKMPTNARLRYLAWVSYVAAPLDEDQKLLTEKVSALMGVTEAQVEQEMARFPGDETRDTDSESAVEVSSENGD